MKRYYNEAETPLKFHKVYHYLVMPYTCLTGLLGLFDYAIYLDTLTNIQYADLAFLTVFTVLSAIIFLGFYSLSGYAWYCVMAFLGLQLLRPLGSLCMTLITYPDQILTGLAYWAADLIFTPLIAIYYIKRKPLFFQPKPVPPPKPTVTSITHSGEQCSPLQGAATEGAAEAAEPPVVTPLAGVTKDAPSAHTGEQCSGHQGALNDVPRKAANFCPNCGKKLRPDYAFCPNCGKRV